MNKAPPTLKISFVDIELIKDIDKPFIQTLKNGSQDKNKIDKYSADLFYIAPLYHRAFKNLDRLIFIDITDLHFYSDIAELAGEWRLLGEGGEAVMAVGRDMSPHYRKFLSDYLLEQPDSELGLPGGARQGLNTGVVIFGLQRMRDSPAYQHFLQPGPAAELISRYRYNLSLGDQDWFTNLAWTRPELFAILPCQYNAQTSIQVPQTNIDAKRQCCKYFWIAELRSAIP